MKEKGEENKRKKKRKKIPQTLGLHCQDKELKKIAQFQLFHKNMPSLRELFPSKIKK